MYVERGWEVDRLALVARDYAAAAEPVRLPVICLHGLTRNGKDFDALATRLSTLGHRVLVPDVRGRGRSSYDPDPMRYHPETYAADAIALLDRLSIGRAVFVGTSMGGIISTAIAATRSDLVAAVVLNDVGPEVAPEGLARIADYAGVPARIETWLDARDYVRRINQVAFPRFDDERWMDFARLTFREDSKGMPAWDYDPAIAVPIKADRLAGDAAEAWKGFARMCRERPVLLIRGTLSDIVSPAILDRMRACAPTMEVTEVPDTGHAPLLDEPAAVDAIENFLERVA